jgi:hypothetical protein
MDNMRRFISTVTLFVMASAVCRANSVPPPTQPNVAVIQRTASTNVPGWRIEVHPDGSVLQIRVPCADRSKNPVSPGRLMRKIDAKLAAGFVKQMQKAMPLKQYKAGDCARSASFGYDVLLQYGGQSSPDINCKTVDKRLKPLMDQARAIERACDVSETN